MPIKSLAKKEMVRRKSKFKSNLPKINALSPGILKMVFQQAKEICKISLMSSVISTNW